MAHDVFINYVYEEKHVADPICAKLESNQKRCWIAPRDIATGEKNASALIHAIDHSAINVVVFSSQNSMYTRFNCRNSCLKEKRLFSKIVILRKKCCVKALTSST